MRRLIEGGKGLQRANKDWSRGFSPVIIAICFLLTQYALAKYPYEYLKEFCQIGQRVPGTEGHRKARDYIINNLRNPEVDSFFTRDKWFYNVYKRFPGKNMRIGVAAHWDSDVGCPGANDGGSGVALLLTLADTLQIDPPKVAIDIIFFDGEDVDKAELLGSKHFASKCVDDYSFILILDMVGDKNLQIFQEGNSAKFFPALVDSIWDIGMEIAPSVFIPVTKYYIVDDHISLIKYGIRAINIIDFDYPYWDSGEDTIDKCSRESLDTMYNFLLRIVYPKYIY
jgi:glutaminyl-peptide cyclotransferase